MRNKRFTGLHRRETRSIFTWATSSLTYQKYTDEASIIAFQEDIMENNYMSVMLQLIPRI